MKQQKVDQLIDLKKNYRIGKGEREFMFPDMLIAHSVMDNAFENFRTPLDNNGKFARVMFKIKIDQEGVQDPNDGNKTTMSNCILLN